MKRIVFSLGLAALTGSCMAIEMPQSATDFGCTDCHAMDHKLVGPAWMDISKRYRDKRNDKAFMAKLVKNVSKGTQDNWGNIPMVATDPAGAKHDQIVELLKFVLALPDQAQPGTGKK